MRSIIGSIPFTTHPAQVKLQVQVKINGKTVARESLWVVCISHAKEEVEESEAIIGTTQPPNLKAKNSKNRQNSPNFNMNLRLAQKLRVSKEWGNVRAPKYGGLLHATVDPHGAPTNVKFVFDWVERCRSETNCTTLGVYHHEVITDGPTEKPEKEWGNPVTERGLLYGLSKVPNCAMLKWWIVAVNRFGMTRTEPVLAQVFGGKHLPLPRTLTMLSLPSGSRIARPRG